MTEWTEKEKTAYPFLHAADQAGLIPDTKVNYINYHQLLTDALAVMKEIHHEEWIDDDDNLLWKKLTAIIERITAALEEEK